MTFLSFIAGSSPLAWRCVQSHREAPLRVAVQRVEVYRLGAIRVAWDDRLATSTLQWAYFYGPLIGPHLTYQREMPWRVNCIPHVFCEKPASRSLRNAFTSNSPLKIGRA